MKIGSSLGLLAVFLCSFDMFVADIPYIHGNTISLVFGIIAMIFGAFC